MASLRLALKASLEATESQPPPKKVSRHKTTDNFSNEPIQPQTQQPPPQQQSRKRSHAESNIISANACDDARSLKKNSRRGGEGEGGGERLEGNKDRKQPVAASSAITPTSSINSKRGDRSATSTPPPSIPVELRERNTPRRAAASRHKSPSPIPSTPTLGSKHVVSASSPSPTPSLVKKADEKGSDCTKEPEEDVKPKKGVSHAKAPAQHTSEGLKLNTKNSGGGNEHAKSTKLSFNGSKRANQDTSTVKPDKKDERKSVQTSSGDGPEGGLVQLQSGKKEKEAAKIEDFSVVDIVSAVVKEHDEEGAESEENRSGEDEVAAAQAKEMFRKLREEMQHETSREKTEPMNVCVRIPSPSHTAVGSGELTCSISADTVNGMSSVASAGGEGEGQKGDKTSETQAAGKGEDVSEALKVKKRREGVGVLQADAAVLATIKVDVEKVKKEVGPGKDKEDAKSADKEGVRNAKQPTAVPVTLHQSPRAAAQLAKSRLSLSGSNKASRTAAAIPPAGGAATPRQNGRKALTSRERKSTAKKDKEKENEKDKAPDYVPPHWVACDMCGKWRSLPGSLDTSMLPEQWFCSMNQWDSKHDTCEAEEEEYVEPASAPVPPSLSAAGGSVESLSSLSGKKKDRPGAGGGRVKRGRRVSRSNDAESDEEERRESRGGSRRRSRGGRSGSVSDPSPPSPGDEPHEDQVVQWVQCNKCSKWRKVPSRIQADLPDIWYCSMNSWAPEYSKCSAREEVDEKISPDGSGGKLMRGERKAATAAGAGTVGGRGKYIRGVRKEADVATISALAAGKTVVKKIQWVQCERKNCKKWRKIPIEVDLSTLPEQWFCEMNRWDPERAACDLAEDSDDESDQPAHQAARTQLILGNSKGPGTLSYRRLIFGADGRIRPFYSGKNKNGYGLFSFTEVFRPSESDEYILPTRRIGYWSSSCFDGSGGKAKTNVTKGAATGKNGSGKSSKSIKTEVQGQEEAAREVAYQTGCSSMRPDHSSDLIDCILRLMPSATPLTVSHGGAVGEGYGACKVHKAFPLKKKCNLLHRMQLASSVVQSSLLLLAGHALPQTVEEIFHGICSLVYFRATEMEQCRVSMGRGELKDTLHRLDQAGAVEATYDNDGELSFRLLLQRASEQGMPLQHNSCPALLASCEPTPLVGKAIPLRMRKRKVGLQSRPFAAEVIPVVPLDVPVATTSAAVTRAATADSIAPSVTSTTNTSAPALTSITTTVDAPAPAASVTVPMNATPSSPLSLISSSAEAHAPSSPPNTISEVVEFQEVMSLASISPLPASSPSLPVDPPAPLPSDVAFFAASPATLSTSGDPNSQTVIAPCFDNSSEKRHFESTDTDTPVKRIKVESETYSPEQRVKVEVLGEGSNSSGANHAT